MYIIPYLLFSIFFLAGTSSVLEGPEAANKNYVEGQIIKEKEKEKKEINGILLHSVSCPATS
jgi:hypothetical protein